MRNPCAQRTPPGGGEIKSDHQSLSGMTSTSPGRISTLAELSPSRSRSSSRTPNCFARAIGLDDSRDIGLVAIGEVGQVRLRSNHHINQAHALRDNPSPVGVAASPKTRTCWLIGADTAGHDDRRRSVPGCIWTAPSRYHAPAGSASCRLPACPRSGSWSSCHRDESGKPPDTSGFRQTNTLTESPGPSR
jgi:hypothetical protein